MYTYEHDEAVRRILNKQTPVLPKHKVDSCVEKIHRMSDIFKEARNRFGSPLYFIDKPSLIQRTNQFLSVFSERFNDFDLYFAMKSCNHPEVLKTLTENGCAIDVSSGAELDIAIACGAEKIVFSGPAKTMKELSKALDHSDKVIILCDSFRELEKLKSFNRRIRIGVRLTTENNPLWRKFGIQPDELENFIGLCGGNIIFCGVQFHSSWNLKPDSHTELIRMAGKTIANLPEEKRERIQFIDIGGGYWPEDGEWMLADTAQEMKLNKQLLNNRCDPLDHRYLPSTNITAYADAVFAAFKEYVFPHVRCSVFTEPGRFIAHESTHMLLTVEDLKLPDIAITDGATNMIGWERYEMDYFPVINVSQISRDEHPMLILGSLCTPHDVWGFTYHGGAIGVDDLLVVPNQGAYTYSLRQNFIKPIPDSVVFDGKTLAIFSEG